MINKDNFKLSIIIPCFNEINTIAELIRRVKESPINSKEIIIVDDLSTDGTKEFLQNINEDSIKLLSQKIHDGDERLKNLTKKE